MMKVTREHYDQLKANFIATRSLMSDADCETMRVKLNEMRKQLAFESCVNEWKEGKTINCADFIEVCNTIGVEISKNVQQWIMADIIEVGKESFSCIGKLHKTKAKTLHALTETLTAKLES
jgi:hypothetical protein